MCRRGVAGHGAPYGARATAAGASAGQGVGEHRLLLASKGGRPFRGRSVGAGVAEEGAARAPGRRVGARPPRRRGAARRHRESPRPSTGLRVRRRGDEPAGPRERAPRRDDPEGGGGEGCRLGDRDAQPRPGSTLRRPVLLHSSTGESRRRVPPRAWTRRSPRPCVASWPSHESAVGTLPRSRGRTWERPPGVSSVPAAAVSMTPPALNARRGECSRHRLRFGPPPIGPHRGHAAPTGSSPPPGRP